MRRLRLLVLLALVPLSALLLREGIAVDSCLDRGGSFDYPLGRCDLQTSHRPSGFAGRHGVLTGATVVAVGGLLVAGVLRRRAR